MFKSIRILGLYLLTFLLLVSACGNQSSNSDSADDKKTEDSATTSSKNDSSSSDSSDSNSESNNSSNSDSSSSDSSVLSEERADRVFDATLKVLSEDGYTTVDFTNKTAVRDGEEMTIELVETEADFKEGLVREKVDDIQSHTLYSFEFDDDNKLTLIEPATLEVIYSE